jgi:hypothetical protein
MEYILTTLLIFLGVAFNVMQKIKSLRKKFPAFGFRSIWGTFVTEEWDSIAISFVVWLCFELAIFSSHYYHLPLPKWMDNWGKFGVPLLVGYVGQRIAYKLLGTSAAVLEKKAEALVDTIDVKDEEK